MWVTLFNISGVAMIGWVLMIFFPKWSVTRAVAGPALFPVFLALLYLIGVVPLVAAAGPGIIADFGTAEGVIGLLRDPDVALIAWIHILVFDQLMGVLIYRDNMAAKILSLPFQSLILLLTLMFGPVGFLLYYTIGFIRKGRPVFTEVTAKFL